jgi:hypothetical protein
MVLVWVRSFFIFVLVTVLCNFAYPLSTLIQGGEKGKLLELGIIMLQIVSSQPALRSISAIPTQFYFPFILARADLQEIMHAISNGEPLPHSSGAPSTTTTLADATSAYSHHPPISPSVHNSQS